MDWEIKVCHSYREANAYVDALAILMFYKRCLAQTKLLYLIDLLGVFVLILISVYLYFFLNRRKSFSFFR
jgi:hypothetical protein